MTTAAANTAFPLGAFFGAPDGSNSSNMTWFKNNYDAFVKVMGVHPTFYDFFTNYTQDPSTWIANASYGAWSGAKSGADYLGPTSGTIPVVGVPLSSTGNGNANIDAFYKAIIAGKEDSIYNGIVDQYANNGYKSVQFRLGWEFNGSWEPWAPGVASNHSAAVNADFVAAFQHVAGLIHAESAKDSITGKVVWNPAVMSSQSGTNGASVTTLYPGNDAVDIISADQYSNAFPLDLTDWAGGGHKQDASYAQWVADPLNREHFWQFPDATQSRPTGTGIGVSLDELIALAKANNKPISLSESGAGGSGSTGPVDDPYFVKWLAEELTYAKQQGVTVTNVNIWSLDSNGGDSFVTPSSTTGQLERPLEGAAWSTYFGANSTLAQDATALGTALPNGVQPTGPVQQSVVQPPNTPATASFTDNAGHSLGPVTVVTTGSTNLYGYQTGLAGNISENVGASGTTIATPSFNLVRSIALTDVGGRSFSLQTFANINLTLGGATAATATVSASTVQSGSIALTDGSYNVTVNALTGGGSASQNLFSVTLGGSGNDTFTLHGCAGITTASVQCGGGSDVMTFLNTGAVSVTGGSGSAVVHGGNGTNTITVGSGAMDVFGGTGTDIYVDHSGKGELIVENFATGRDQLWLDKGLQSSLQQVATSGGLALEFGGSTTPAVLLHGISAIAASDMHWQ